MPDTRRQVRPAAGVRLDCLEAGPESGPLVFLLHGFPEDALSRWARRPIASTYWRATSPPSPPSSGATAMTWSDMTGGAWSPGGSRRANRAGCAAWRS